MADWLVEEGIAEHRAARFDGERIVAARVEWPGNAAAGWVIEAKLIARTSGSTRGTALAENGEEILVDRLPLGCSEGTIIRLEIVRAALSGPGRYKRAQGRPSQAPLARPSLAERIGARVVRRFPGEGWDELIGEALSREIAFAGGTLSFAVTPAMTTVDIDGTLPARALAVAAVPCVADALRRFDLGGSIAIDFPTLADKIDRRAVDQALESELAGWPHERTAINGFGLAQIVARLERPSLLHLATWQTLALAWRRILRTAEMLDGSGAIEFSVHPALQSAIAPDHLAALERRTGSSVRVRNVATAVPHAPHVQRVAR